jgi:hypothetical protein
MMVLIEQASYYQILAVSFNHSIQHFMQQNTYQMLAAIGANLNANFTLQQRPNDVLLVRQKSSSD